MKYRCGPDGGNTYNDKWLIEVLYPGVTNGFYVEAGAGSWKSCSASYCLEQLGWSGISVEPYDKFYNEFVTARRNPCIYAALAGEDGNADFVCSANGFYSGLTRNITTIHKDDAYAIGYRLQTIHTICFRTLLLGYPKQIHVVMLDIEGSEVECLRSFPYDEYEAGCFIVENSHSDIAVILNRHGYIRAQNEFNTKAPWELYFIKPEVVQTLNGRADII